ncbi:Hsp20/alpha crystallin family protein [Novosphingobium bradum]|uniref:Hsp20/alpha crystallin family protein n=1 Tax=Novosphingobium bradum TaxID=1737444 RepID=A0ABV7INC0_9SPHN
MANRQLTPYRRGGMASSSGGAGSGFGGGFGFGGSLFDLSRQMNRLFDDLIERGPTGAQAGGTFSAPALEVHQSDDRLEITAELPGVREEDIDLTIEDGLLTLSGEKRSDHTDEQRGYSERTYGRFERTITLPTNVNEEAARAQFRNGVLTITLPRAAERPRGRKIPLGGAQQAQVGQVAHNDAHPAPAQQAAQQPRGSSSQQGEVHRQGDKHRGPGQQG